MDPKQEIRLEQSLLKTAQLTPLLKKALSPALSAIGLDFFWYNRFIDGDKYFSLGTIEIAKQYYLNFSSQDLFFKNENVLVQKQTVVIWDLEQESAMLSHMDNVGVRNIVSVYRRRKHYLEGWHFGSSNKKQHLNHFYVNNISAIYRLIDFFQHQVLPQLPFKNQEFYTPYVDGFVMKLPPTQVQEAENLSDFYDATKLKKFTLYHESREVRLSFRELQCLCLLLQGKIAKEIAKKLSLSVRTVESHIASIRNKTGCSDNSELYSLYQQSDVSSWFEGH